MSLTSRCFPMLALVAAFFVGCSSDGKPAPEYSNAVATLTEVQTEVSNAKNASANVSSALTKLQNTSDVKKAFAEYSDAVAKMDYHAGKVKDRWMDMQSRREEYQFKWNDEMSKITDPSVKAAIESRRAELTKHVKDVTAASKAVSEAYKPYKTKIQEIQKALTLDPTAQAVTLLKPAITEAQNDQKDLNAKISRLQTLLDNLMPEVKARRG